MRACCGCRAIKKRNRAEKSSQVKGVNFDKATEKWLVRVVENGKQRYHGRYATQKQAEEAQANWKKTQAAAATAADVPTAQSSGRRGRARKQPAPVEPLAKKKHGSKPGAKATKKS